MKHSILLLLLFSSLIGKGQNKPTVLIDTTNWVDISTSGNPADLVFVKSVIWTGPRYYQIVNKNMNNVLKWPTESDTLEISIPLQIHYIKIGKSIYRIVEHEPTIEVVEPKIFQGILQQYWGPDITPANLQPVNK